MAVQIESGRAVAPGGVPEGPRDCVLGVERSLNGRRWEARLGDARLGLALAQSLDMPEVLGRALTAGDPLGYTVALGLPRLRARIAQLSGEHT